MRGLAIEGQWPQRGRGGGATGAMEGVLYKWTNYLSGEWGARQGLGPLSEQLEGEVGTCLLGVGVTVTTPPGTIETCADREYFFKALHSQDSVPCAYIPLLGLGEGNSYPFT